MSTPDDEARLLADVAREIQAHPPMTLALNAATAFALVGVVQLALRHPNMAGSPRATAEAFVAAVAEHFASSPAVLEVLRRGADPAHESRKVRLYDA